MKLTRFFAAILIVVTLATVSVNASVNDKYFSEDFTDMDLAYSRFILGQWEFLDGGGIYGYADAKALQTNFDNSCGVFECPWCYRYIYLDYDVTVTLTTRDDDTSDSDRWVNLVYLNENPLYHGTSDDRIMMCFSYDFQNDCFRFTEGWSNTSDEGQILPPVSMGICDDGSGLYTLGMTVEKNRIRCFYNGEIIFDYEDTEEKYLIAHNVEVPFVFWQEGNCVQIKNISIDRPGYLLPASYYYGDASGDGKINLIDVTAIMKHIAKWKGLDFNIYAADTNRDGKITLSDASRILMYVAKWEGVTLG